MKIDNYKNNIWQNLKDYFEDDSTSYYGGCVDKDKIADAERKPGLRFDDSYKN